MPGLELRAGANWNHARFGKFIGVPCWRGQMISEGCDQVPQNVTSASDLANGYFVNDPVSGRPVRYTAQDLSGTRLPRSPDLMFNLGFSHELPVGQDLVLGFGSDMQYVSKYVTLTGNRPDFYRNGYAKFNANISVKGSDDGWELALIGNNLTNQITTGGCSNANTAGGVGLPGSISGANVRGPAGIDELVCILIADAKRGCA